MHNENAVAILAETSLNLKRFMLGIKLWPAEYGNIFVASSNGSNCFILYIVETVCR